MQTKPSPSGKLRRFRTAVTRGKLCWRRIPAHLPGRWSIETIPPYPGCIPETTHQITMGRIQIWIEVIH